MLKRILFLTTGAVLLLMVSPQLSRAQNDSTKVLDRIVAQVNNHIILKSDVDSVVAQYLQQSNNTQFSKDLWYEALESEVNKYVVLAKAKIDSVTVTDGEVERQLDQRITQMEQQIGGQKALENYFGKSVVQLKAEWRKLYRQEAIVQKERSQEMNNISITRPEVVNYFNSIPKDSIPTIPEEVQVAQIVRIPPPKANADSAAYHLAEELRDSIVVYGKSMEALAKRWSDDKNSAANGGHIGMVSIKDLVPSYSAAASALKPGQISQVVKSPFGYHIIRLNKRVGDKIDTNHILIAISDTNRDNKKAIDFLNAIRDSVLNQGKSFADMARKYSQDDATAPNGGLLTNPQNGDNLIPLDQLDPSLYRIVLLLDKPGDISEPKPYTTNDKKNAYRIVMLEKHIDEHKANLKQDYDLIKNAALHKKQSDTMHNWLMTLRSQVYVHFRIPMPAKFRTPGASLED